MKNIFLIILFATGLLLASCSKSNPQPTCEEGGVEVKK
jgi:hypothetical protein